MAFIVMLAVHTLYTICFDSSSSSSGSGRTFEEKNELDHNMAM